MSTKRQPGHSGKISMNEVEFYRASFLASPRTCTACESTDTEAITEITHCCNECGNVFHLDNLPPTPEDEDLEDVLNMFDSEDLS